jgi:3'(2'), 5'-bisphosphate nucleotidase
VTQWDVEREVAVRAVRAAAVVCREIQGRIRIDALSKADRSPVTLADYAAQAVVGRILADEMPDDPVIGEESGAALRTAEGRPFLTGVAAELGVADVDVVRWVDHCGATRYAPRMWTLDPVDGTKGFLRREQYAVALALLVEGTVSVAALACPNLPWPEGDGVGVVFAAVVDDGATWEPAFVGGASRPIAVSTTTDPARLRVCSSVERSHSSEGDGEEAARRLGITGAPIRMDSQAKYGLVGSGGAEIYLRLPVRASYQEKIWDHAAGSLVVTEAGGRVTDVDGRPLDFTRGPTLAGNRGIVATHGPLHDDILATLSALRQPAGG